jgi:hypothetical protein
VGTLKYQQKYESVNKLLERRLKIDALVIEIENKYPLALKCKYYRQKQLISKLQIQALQKG